jgi:hypothetical protein
MKYVQVDVCLCHNSGSQGEVDIVEGVNDQTPNTCSLHTSSSKITFKGRKLWVLKLGFRLYNALFSLNDRVSELPGIWWYLMQFGFSTSDGTDCDAYDNNNSGCGVSINDNKSYGPQFNSNGGGWYALHIGH